MNRCWLVLPLLVSGCIEGPDPNACNVDPDCDDGRLCSAMMHCEKPEDVVEITVHWTFGGVAPTPEAPSGCASFDAMMVGASNVGGDGFGVFVECTAGSTQLVHVPWDMTLMGANGYRSIGDGASEIVGSAELDRQTTMDVTLVFALP